MNGSEYRAAEAVLYMIEEVIDELEVGEYRDSSLIRDLEVAKSNLNFKLFRAKQC
ncbi:hypothetical protein [Vibrio phage vB_VpaP_SJSY21]|nr:hypothetical protein [Vibrio phage vB_VpaP_SJSY21]